MAELKQRVLVVAAHPDDEVIGCGGTLARHAFLGDEVKVAFLADGESARRHSDISARREMAHLASKSLGLSKPIFLGLPDNSLDSLPLLKIVQELEAVVLSFAPTIIYTHHSGDLNIDHRIANQATLTAFRPQPGSRTKAIYSFEVNSSTEWQGSDFQRPFNPQRYVDIGMFWRSKLEGLAAYESEMRSPPHSRSLEGIEILNRWRGQSVGLEMAEAFSVIREIV